MNYAHLIANATVGEMTPYHNGSTKTGRRRKAPPTEERTVIAWDMEGMNLSGEKKPQHPVIFGCSIEPDKVLVSRELTTFDMLSYILAVGDRNPHAIHVGYGFQYDANMLVKDLSYSLLERLWKEKRVRFRDADGHVFKLQWYPRKFFRVSRYDNYRASRRRSGDHGGTTVTIYDFSSFFGTAAFLTAAESILKDEISPEDREVIAHGKADRGSNTWDDLAEVLYYHERELHLMQRVFEKFRDVMCRCGFPLQKWYGPGALANFINDVRGLRPHLVGAQTTSGLLPEGAHAAIKTAFSGGRFEPFMAGRISVPSWAIDLNNAYPYALTMIPSLSEDQGKWEHVEQPSTIERFGFYRITYVDPKAHMFDIRPMPLFYRDHRGMITYPNVVTGWYASPEALMVQGMKGAIIHEGWVWKSVTDCEFPWQFLREMYDRRLSIGKGNPLSIPFKLGPNSLYGKYAQTVGWDQEKNLPPRSHALAIAAWVTSFTRARIFAVVRQIPESVVSIETDSVLMTVDPATLRNVVINDELGNWSVKQYDEVIYLQSGMYHTRSGQQWTIHSRGVSSKDFPVESVRTYLESLSPGREWGPLHIHTKPRFVGIGAALNIGHHFRDHWRVWRSETRKFGFGDSGKRRHIPKVCDSCQQGLTPWDAPHRLVTVSPSDGITPSHARRLPWEDAHTPEVEEIRKHAEIEKDILP